MKKAAGWTPVRKIIEYQNTDLYPWVIGAVFCVFYVLGWDLANFYMLAAWMIFTFLFNEDTQPFFPLLCLTPFAFSFYHAMPDLKNSVYYTSPAVLAQLFTLLGLVVAALLYRVIADKLWRTMFKPTRLTVGLGFLALGLILNGFAAPEYDRRNLGYALLFIACIVVLYFFLMGTLKWEKGVSMRRFAHAMFMTGVVIAVEVLALYLSDPVLRQTFDKGHVLLGWGISNTIGGMLLLFLPFGMYLVHTARRALPYLLLTSAVTIAIVFTFSRGSLVFAVPIMVGGLIYSCIDARDKRTVLIFSLFLAVVGIVVWAFNSEKLLTMLKFYIESGFDDSGRFDIWKDGFDRFKQSPIFGYGFNYKFGEVFPGIYFMHNTVFQVLYACGIVGLGCYLYHRGETIYVMVRRLTVDRVFLGVALLALIGNGLVDISMTHPLSLLFYGAVLAYAEKDFLWAEQNARNRKLKTLL